MNIKIDTVDLNATPHGTTGARLTINIVTTKTRIFDANLQKKLLSEYDLAKIKQQEWTKHIADKKTLMTLISGQYNNATLTKLALGATYEVDYNEGDLIKFLNKLKVVFYKINDSGLSFKPYKVVVVVKSLHNFTNPRATDPNGFKEEVKVKYDATMAIVGKFPNRTVFLE